MKIGIIHFSDLHLNSDFCIDNNRENKMVETISRLLNETIDKIFIVITGDIANKGTESDYKKATKFINTIDKALESKTNVKNKILLVPGNHDIYFDSDYSDDINRFNNDKYLAQEEVKTEISRMDNYFAFSKKYNLFNDNKKYDFYSYKKDNFTINFCLVNSALFSLKDSQGDKGHHNISEEILNEIEQSSTGNINIFLTHHSIDWFDWKTKVRLESICNNYYSIVLYGHEHYSKVQKLMHDDSMDTLYIQGDETVKENKIMCFSVYTLDTDTKSFYVNSYNYDSKSSLFVKEKESKQYRLIYKTKENRVIQLNEDFEEELLVKDNDSKSLLDYFIFPKLSYYLATEKGNDKCFINDYNALKQLTANKKIINFTGIDCVGKTSLLNYLFLKEINSGNLPIRINKDDWKIKIELLIKKCFNRQYEKKEDYKVFEASIDKILFIDDYESIENSKILLDNYIGTFKKIYIFNR